MPNHITLATIREEAHFMVCDGKTKRPRSLVSVNVVPGTIYFIEIAGNGGCDGLLNLSVSCTPAKIPIGSF